MRSRSVLPQVHALPRPESELSTGHWNRLGRATDHRARVGRHIIRALVVVFPVSSLGCQIIHPTAEIAEHRRVGVLLNDEARGGVLDEHRAQAGSDTALVNN